LGLSNARFGSLCGSNYCSDEKNFKVPVMKAVEQVLGKGN